MPPGTSKFINIINQRAGCSSVKWTRTPRNDARGERSTSRLARRGVPRGLASAWWEYEPNERPGGWQRVVSGRVIVSRAVVWRESARTDRRVASLSVSGKRASRGGRPDRERTRSTSNPFALTGPSSASLVLRRRTRLDREDTLVGPRRNRQNHSATIF